MQRLTHVMRHMQLARPAFQGVRMLSSQAVAGSETEPAPVRVTPHPNGSVSITLHRPKALNALNLQMVRLMTSGLKEHAAKARCVLVYGEGERAFCAGGDIRALAFPSHPMEPSNFFREEYHLNHLIHRCPSPYVSILRGITMGGGVGISVHGQVRVITDNTMFAMPETGIGLFPDVGGTWFLPRLPGAIGMYLALTGQSLGAADTLYSGVGTHFIPLSSIPDFIKEVESSPSSLDSLLEKYSTAPPADKPETKLKSFLPQRRDLIDRVFAAESYEAVLENLEKELANSNDEGEKQWIQSVQKQLSTKSPTSLLITFHAMQLGKQASSLAECLSTELRLGARITAEGEGGDFSEGVKAVVVDKKHKPQWKPKPTMEEIKNKYFAPFTKEEGIEELNL